MEIHLGCSEGFVPEPEGDDGGVHSAVQHLHGARMAEHMGCDRLATERGAGGLSCDRMVADEQLDRVGAEPSASTGGKQRVSRPAAAFPEPDPQRADGLPGKRRDAFFAALAVGSDVWASAEIDVADDQAREFREAQAGLEREEQESVVPTASPGRAVWRREECRQFPTVEECDESPFESLGRDGQDALDVVRVLGVLEGRVAEEAVDGSESGVACADTVLAVAFEMLQEGADERRVDVREVESRGRLPVRSWANAMSRRKVSR